MPAEPVADGALPLPDIAARPDPAARGRRLPVVSLGIITLFVLVAILAPLLSPGDPGEQSLRNRFKPPVWMEGGSSRHLLGTDRLGRDMLSRIVWGSRVSLTAGASKRSLFVPGFETRAGWNSHHAWLAATFFVCAGRCWPPNTWMPWYPCHENSWLSHTGTNGQRARASCRSGSVR